MIRQSLVAYGAPLVETETPPPSPTGTEVLLRVRHCGVCHSDLHLIDGHLDLGEGKRLDLGAGRALPFTLGHEISGFVEACGSDAGTLDRAAPFAVYPWIGCGSCPLCQGGREHLCEQPRQIGIHTDGGYAGHVLVPHPRYLIDATGIDALLAGSLMCAGLTAYAAMRKALPYLHSRALAVLGLGGVGLMALEIAKALGAGPVAVIDTDDAKRTAALARGAALALDGSQPETRKDMQRALGAPGAALDFVGSGATLALAQSLVGKGGAVVAVGLMGGRLSLAAPMLPLRELALFGSYVGSLAEAREVIALARRGLSPIPIAARPLSQANGALADLRAGRILGRAALTPPG